MRGDFSRSSWQPAKGYRQVLLQQGRVALDADFNEQGELSADGLRQLTRDLLGPHAGPAGALGFAIGADGGGFTIAPGHYYVDGWRAVNHRAAAVLRYDTQAGFPFPGAVDSFDDDQSYLFYLDVWERTVTSIEDVTIREAALGGADTALRRQLVSQVRAIVAPDGVDSAEKATRWLSEHVLRHPPASSLPGPRLPQMRAFVDPKDDPDDTPCVADPLGGYTGLENQLYRVEVHAAPAGAEQAGSGTLTFKWSRENASVAAAWVGRADHDLLVEGVRDTAHGFSPGQWVELTDTVGELRGQSGVMVRLIGVDRDRLTYDPASASTGVPDIDALVDPVVRRWDHGQRRSDKLLGGAIVLSEDTDHPLERGIKVRFPKSDGGDHVYATGDHWVFPARTATADIEWPFEALAGGSKAYLAQEPDGVEHAYAPLALVAPGAAPESFQRKIKPLWSPA